MARFHLHFSWCSPQYGMFVKTGTQVELGSVLTFELQMQRFATIQRRKLPCLRVAVQIELFVHGQRSQLPHHQTHECRWAYPDADANTNRDDCAATAERRTRHGDNDVRGDDCDSVTRY